MKIFLKGYLSKNLGDDLFFKIIMDRYKSNQFYIIGPNSYKKIFNKNVRFYSNLLEKFLKRIFKGYFSIEKKIQKKADISVLIGGSMFIEKKFEKASKYIKYTEKPYFVLGANFGPYYTKKYKKIYHNFFKKITDTCFRDLDSYKEFKDIKNVRYAPDIVFLEKTKIKKAKEKTVLFSLINIKNKSSQMEKDSSIEYEEAINTLINYFGKKDYTIKFMSFCKKEKDEEEVNKYYEKYKNKYKVSKYFYNGDIEEGIDQINNNSVIVGSRFHANILGLKLQKHIIPISYNNKTINMLKDIKFDGEIIDLNNYKKLNIEKIEEKNLTYKCDISNFIKEAEKHFEKLDSLIKLRKDNINE